MARKLSPEKAATKIMDMLARDTSLSIDEVIRQHPELENGKSVIQGRQPERNTEKSASKATKVPSKGSGPAMLRRPGQR